MSPTAPGTFSAWAINHVLGAGPFLSGSYVSTDPAGERPPARHGAPLRPPGPRPRADVGPALAPSRLQGTCAQTAGLLRGCPGSPPPAFLPRPLTPKFASAACRPLPRLMRWASRGESPVSLRRSSCALGCTAHPFLPFTASLAREQQSRSPSPGSPSPGLCGPPLPPPPLTAGPAAQARGQLPGCPRSRRDVGP